MRQLGKYVSCLGGLGTVICLEGGVLLLCEIVVIIVRKLNLLYLNFSVHLFVIYLLLITINILILVHKQKILNKLKIIVNLFQNI